MVHRSIHPVHAVLLAGSLPLFIGVLLSDWAYSSSYEIQWKNFASWLLVGALVLGGLTLLWALIDVSRAAMRTPRRLIYVSLLLVLWVLGLINALVHAADAWASMPAALYISVITALLALAVTCLGFAHSYRGATQ